MRFFRHDDGSPKPPLAGQMVGLAIGLLLLSFAALVALDVVKILVPIVLPLLALIGVYTLMFRRHK
ncbi:hypothetical protein [Umezawaea sp. Da 62-37]|uniref:hypothetical protein n=1 Tax=Umezawaea sp. Da 62-37 TaxID=3075927 RepID=UPI0028F7231B|nr:hypothetical protein [Umezawaea sp. Da 62-37]WNV83471.1 hypothetical protein RM788_35575 [Umezawaea sp. Da 62-37]